MKWLFQFFSLSSIPNMAENKIQSKWREKTGAKSIQTIETRPPIEWEFEYERSK